MKQLCATVTDEGALSFKAGHTPLTNAEGHALELTVSQPPAPNHLIAVRVRVCSRCGATYTDVVERNFSIEESKVKVSLA